MKSTITLILGLILTLLVIWMAYKFSRFLGLKLARTGNVRYLKEIDRLIVGNEEYIAVVQMGLKYYLIGVTKQNISFLSELDKESLVELEAEPPGELFGRESEFFSKFRDKVTALKTKDR